MLLIGIIVTIVSWIALMGVGALVNRAVRHSAPPVEAALHRVMPDQSRDIETKYTPTYAKVLSLFFTLCLVCGIIISLIGLFQMF